MHYLNHCQHCPTGSNYIQVLQQIQTFFFQSRYVIRLWALGSPMLFTYPTPLALFWNKSQVGCIQVLPSAEEEQFKNSATVLPRRGMQIHLGSNEFRVQGSTLHSEISTMRQGKEEKWNAGSHV